MGLMTTIGELVTPVHRDLLKGASVARIEIHFPCAYKPSRWVESLSGEVINVREMTYSAAHEFSTQAGLNEFFSELEGDGGYPCTAMLLRRHLLTLKKALSTFSGSSENADRLAWHIFWVDHALNTCVRPAIRFS